MERALHYSDPSLIHTVCHVLLPPGNPSLAGKEWLYDRVPPNGRGPPFKWGYTGGTCPTGIRRNSGGCDIRNSPWKVYLDGKTISGIYRACYTNPHS